MRIFDLSRLELRKYGRGDLARASVIALVFLPLLYGTVYLVAFWTPYSNLDHIPAVIVNLDKPATAQGQKVDAGRQMTETLLHSQSMTWTEASPADALEGIKSGRYYFMLEIPENFSASIASLGSTDPGVGVATLTTNDANSFLTSLVGEDFADQVAAGLNQTVVQGFVDQTLDGIIQIRSNLKQAAKGAGQLANGTDQLKSGSGQLASGAGQVAAGNAQLAEAADVARDYAEDAQVIAQDVVVQMRALVKQFPDSLLAQDLLEGAIRVNAQIDTVTNKVIGATRQVDKLGAGAQQLATGAKQLHAGAKQLNSGAQQLSGGLSSGVEQLPTWSKAQATDIANHVSEPTVIRQVQLNSTGTYGAGFAPYFMSMALWIAALVVFTLLAAVPIRILLAPRINAFGAAMTGFLPVLFLVVAQVIILLAVIRFGLGISPNLPDLALLVPFLILVGGTYAAIIQLLNLVLGISGKLVALILLMLQLCSCGGTYPIEMSPPFFQAISPYLPMTYAVTGVRHLLVDADLAPVLRSTTILLAMLAIVLSASTLWLRSHRRVGFAELKPEVEM